MTHGYLYTFKQHELPITRVGLQNYHRRSVANPLIEAIIVNYLLYHELPHKKGKERRKKQ
jgi:hypothetical protein